MEDLELLRRRGTRGPGLAGGQPRGGTEHYARTKCPGKADARQQENRALRETEQSNPTCKRSLHAADSHSLPTTRTQNRKLTVQSRSCASLILGIGMEMVQQYPTRQVIAVDERRHRLQRAQEPRRKKVQRAWMEEQCPCQEATIYSQETKSSCCRGYQTHNSIEPHSMQYHSNTTFPTCASRPPILLPRR